MKKHPIYNQISTDTEGNIYSNGKYVKGTISTTGYRQYSVEGKSKLGHRLIAECLMGRQLDSTEVVNHKNQDRLDNHPSNLEIGTQTDNIHHYWQHYGEITETDVEILNPHKAGENHHNARLRLSDVCTMIGMMFEGSTNKQLSEIYGVHDRYISLIRHKKRWKKAWIELGLEGSETIPSGSRVKSKCSLETETSLQLRDMI